MKAISRRALALMACALFFSQVPTSQAGTVLAFGQSASGSINAVRSGSSTLIQTDNGDAIAITITSLNGVTVNQSAYLKLVANSVGAASTSVIPMVGTLITETFNGSFSITANANGTGTNFLSGIFAGVTLGFESGAAGTLISASPPASISFSSDVIPTLSSPKGLSFSFSGIAPGLSVVDNTIDSFSAQTAGTFSAVPEPSSIVTLALGAAGMIGFGLRRRAVRLA